MTDRILGVDPGTSITGYGVLERNGSVARLIECGVIRTRPSDPLWNRLHDIHQGLMEIIRVHQPDTLAVEGIFVGRNVRSTIVLGHTRGTVLLAAAQAGLDVVEFSPATVKKTVVGNGRAEKTQVAFMVQQLLHLESPPQPADAADGVAIALTQLLTTRS